MHGVTYSDVSGKLGSVLTSIVEVEGEPVEGLLDTGSPITMLFHLNGSYSCWQSNTEKIRVLMNGRQRLKTN